MGVRFVGDVSGLQPSVLLLAVTQGFAPPASEALAGQSFTLGWDGTGPSALKTVFSGDDDGPRSAVLAQGLLRSGGGCGSAFVGEGFGGELAAEVA